MIGPLRRRIEVVVQEVCLASEDHSAAVRVVIERVVLDLVAFAGSQRQRGGLKIHCN